MKTKLIFSSATMLLILSLTGCGASRNSIRDTATQSSLHSEWMSISESDGRKTFKTSDTIYTGRDILLSAQVNGVRNGTPAVFRIRSRRSDNVREVKGSVFDDKAEAIWCVECLEPLSSIKKGEAVSYTFTCEVKGTTCAESTPAALNFVCRVSVMGPEDVSDLRCLYELRSKDGSYRKKIRVADGIPNKDDPCYHILEFDGVKPGLVYRLDFFAEEGVSPNTAKENASFAEIME